MAHISFNAKLADLSVGVSCPSQETRDFLANYITDAPCSFSVSVTEEDVSAEASAETARNSDFDGGKLLYELSALQRKIAEVFPLYGRILMHGAAITYHDDAYLFCAPSGVGKSTHISLWKRYLGKEVDIINGDKPFLSLDDGNGFRYFRVHGSPWAGKEHWQKNRSAPLRAICFISHDNKNSISRLQPERSLLRILRQVYIPRNTEAASETLHIVDRLVSNLPLYHLRCNISEDAVKCCFEALTGLDYPSNI